MLWREPFLFEIRETWLGLERRSGCVQEECLGGL